MTTGVTLYFQVHQPKRLRHYTYFDIGKQHLYEDEKANREIFLKVANKCYLPTTKLLLELIHQYPQFKIAFSLSGVFLEQCQRFCPKLLANFKALVATGQVELLSETYYHSLSFLYSPQEFERQVLQHQQLIKELFNYQPTTFRNTELIYNNAVAQAVEKLGYNAILTEGADKILGWRSPNYLYQPVGCPKLKLLLRNYSLTDDIAFRFSEKNWDEYPLTADKYAAWLHALAGNADLINLFMDFETFGEHQWESTGIFTFLRQLPEIILRHPDYCFVTPQEAAQQYQTRGELDVPEFISWADLDRDLSAWRGNNLQDDALAAIYALEQDVYATGDDGIIKTWRSLLTSDHFYYMCTKYAADGDVHKYFSPYGTPYEAYINYQNVLTDFSQFVRQYNEKLALQTKVESCLISWWSFLGRKLGFCS